ncbi:MAG: alanine:cation symporter family protein, partial [Bacteroidetes bacterium]|nr:alanine:cation symporter family protein [Bacteroidota bacterium]
NIGEAFTSIFSSVFTGSAAVGGFLGASINFAFSKGVGRGLFSNEAGQGSAPIAHASAKGHEPVSEGMVAILEPFIDTIIICTLTGLVLLTSGVWKEKHENRFQFTDIAILDGVYVEANENDKQKVGAYLVGNDDIAPFNGEIQVEDGLITQGNFTILHARSFAEEITISNYHEDTDELEPYTGVLVINNGKPTNEDLKWRGKSLVHSAPLTSIAFTKSFFGDFGKYIVTIGLLLFAFSTAISWSYYGDRAITFLVGSRGILPYRIVYILGFFIASFTDTTIIWTFAGLAIALMTIPNLIGIIWLRKDMKNTLKSYWEEFIAK